MNFDKWLRLHYNKLKFDDWVWDRLFALYVIEDIKEFSKYRKEGAMALHNGERGLLTNFEAWQRLTRIIVDGEEKVLSSPKSYWLKK
jgi:hypothetical protein